MKILSIETSCDETAIAILSATGNKNPKFKIEAHNVASQIKLHQQYGGVFPMMAKREHSKNIFPLFVDTLKKGKIFKKIPEQNNKNIEKIKKILEREPELLEIFIKEMPFINKPKIDKIAITVGPGLVPALWVGVNFAKALSLFWNIPIVPVNHMEGHILSVFSPNKKDIQIKNLKLPLISLLVSGGHTELVLMNGIGKYKIIGQTRDDAAGEAFDKVARMLGLQYPGGPLISRLASEFSKKKENILTKKISLPRPMINSKDFDFSFSGLKTAVLYLLRDLGEIDDQTKSEIAYEFESAVVDVLVFKTMASIKKYNAKNLIVGGGVSANIKLKKCLEVEAKKINIKVIFPEKDLSTDNAIMIGIAGFFNKSVPINSKKLIAKGNLSF